MRVTGVLKNGGNVLHDWCKNPNENHHDDRVSFAEIARVRHRVENGEVSFDRHDCEVPRRNRKTGEKEEPRPPESTEKLCRSFRNVDEMSRCIRCVVVIAYGVELIRHNFGSERVDDAEEDQENRRTAVDQGLVEDEHVDLALLLR